MMPHLFVKESQFRFLVNLTQTFVSDFRDILPEVSKAVNNCTFLSVDCEFTGNNLFHTL